MRLPLTSLTTLSIVARSRVGFARSSCSLLPKPKRSSLTTSSFTATATPPSQAAFAIRDRIQSYSVRRNMVADKDTAHASSKKKSLFLFDFDGVVCDSCDECTVSAWRTCKVLKAIPQSEDTSGDVPPKWLFDKMREIRPAIEVGWQIPVLLSVFLDQKQTSAATGRPAMTVPEIIRDYESLVDDWLTKHNLKEENMVQTFGTVRDDWISNDLASWLDINTFYEGISKGISDCQGEAVLVTTKQHRFATALVRHAGVKEHAMPDDSIYGLGMYKSKSDVIVDRMQKGGYERGSTHFFEDRWPTIAKCLNDNRLDGVNFYLCSWGYCTRGELELAENEPRVKVLTLEDFANVVTD